jgi:hypothetical protein
MNMRKWIAGCAITASLTFPPGSLEAASIYAVDPECIRKLAAAGPPATFDAVVNALPSVEKKSQYESTADYERRLAAASTSGARPILLNRKPAYGGQGLSYDADRRILKIYPSAFGAGVINFTTIFGMGSHGLDAFASAVAFSLEVIETGKDSYEATNGFGARVTVTRTTRRVHALWERHGKNGESPFVGTSPFKPPVELSMAPDIARDVIERGSIAFLAVPKPPFTATGTDGVGPDFQRPTERVDHVTALIADVQCAYVRASDGTAIAAFAVR